MVLCRSRAERSGNALSQQSQTNRWNLLMQRRRFVSHQTCEDRRAGYTLTLTPDGQQSRGAASYLCDVSKLLAGEVDEGQVVEAGGDGGVVLDEGVPVGVLGEELVNAGVVTQQTTMGSERQAAEITPTNTTRELTSTFTSQRTSEEEEGECVCVCVWT